MLNWVSRLLLMTCYFALSACQAKEPANLKMYLLQHPSKLRDEIALCKTSKRDFKRCETVVSAATDMQALIEEQQKHPQEFGMRILRAQIAYSKTGEGGEEMKVLLAI